MEQLLEEFYVRTGDLTGSLYQEWINKRIIVLNGETNSSLVESVIIPLLIMERDKEKPVTFYINTCGGSIIDTMTICNIIDNYSAPLNIYVLGQAASAGTYILCAGNHNPNVKKYCYKFSVALIHAGGTCLNGETNVVRDTYVFLEDLDSRIRNYMIENTKITEEDLNQKNRKEWYLFAEEMKEKGLVDEII